MKVGDLVKFKTGYIGTVLSVTKDFGSSAVVWIHGTVNFQNPTRRRMEMLQLNSEVVSESR